MSRPVNKSFVNFKRMSLLRYERATYRTTDLFMFHMRRQAGHQELAERLVEIQYELTDRLTFYLCGRRPGREKLLPGISLKNLCCLCISSSLTSLLLSRPQERAAFYHPTDGRQVQPKNLPYTVYRELVEKTLVKRMISYYYKG